MIIIDAAAAAYTSVLVNTSYKCVIFTEKIEI